MNYIKNFSGSNLFHIINIAENTILKTIFFSVLFIGFSERKSISWQEVISNTAIFIEM